MTTLILVGLRDSRKQQQSSEGNVTLIIRSIGNTTTEKFKVVKATASELLKDKHKVDLNYGKYIRCIDGVCVNREYMWSFYLNDKLAQLGAYNYFVKDGDKIRFEFTNRGG